jgi:flagellar basal-body rod protein FlgB
MNPTISAILTKALDGLSLRSQATAQNIANVNSRSYRPLSVSFESELKAAASKGEAAVRALPLTMHQTSAAENVRMDLELETQSETAMRYGALVDVLGRELSLERTVIRGGQ